MNINEHSYGTGRQIKEGGELVNTTDSYFYMNDSDVSIQVVDNKLFNASKAQEITDDQTLTDFIAAPGALKHIIVKGALIHGDGNSGITKIHSTDNSKTILVLYHANSSNIAPSGEINVICPVNNGITITSTGRAGKQTFIGISYRIISADLATKILALNGL